MSEVGKYLAVGPYRVTLPDGARVSVRFSEVNKNVPNRELMTHWQIDLKKFTIGIHLDVRPLGELKRFIDYSTKSDVTVKSLKVGEIEGVTYGAYDKPKTWIDWWLLKGDLTLCMNLQSLKFPWAEATDEDKETHDKIIHSIIYTPKFGVIHGT